MRFVKLLLLTSIAVFLLAYPVFAQEIPKSLAVGDKVEPFQAVGIDGSRFNLSWYEGIPVIVDIFATWCPPCRQELPALSELALTYPMQFYILAVSVDDEKNADAVKKFVEDNKIEIQVVHDTDRTIAAKFPTEYIPALTVIGKDGTVMKKFEGFDQELIPTLTEMLDLKLPESSNDYADRGYLLYDQMQNLDRALADFEKALEINSFNSRARCGRGEVLVDMGKKDEGVKDLLRAIELGKSNARAYMNLGYLEEGVKNYDKALEWYSIGAESIPDDERLINYRDAMTHKLEILNTPAPDFTVTNLKGDTITLSDLKGKKAVIIDSWATWCGPCRLEMPKLQELYDAHSDQVEIIAISNEKELETIKNFIDEQGFTFNIVQDVDGIVKGLYPSKYIPFLTIISKDGLILETMTGYHEDVLEQLNAILGL